MSNNQPQTLSIRVVSVDSHSTSSDVDAFSLQFGLNFKEKDKYEEVIISKNSDDDSNKTIIIPLKDLNDESNLYVEVRDMSSDDKNIIGFAAIPINQVVNANGFNMNGLFDIYSAKDEISMMLHLQLAVTGLISINTPELNDRPLTGKSYVQDEHFDTLKLTKSDLPKDENAIEEWETNYRYNVGDRVKYRGKVYDCIMEHVSNPGWNPSEAFTLWKLKN